MTRERKIIVAEDDQDQRMMIVKILSARGYDVLGLPDGTSIIEKKYEWPDLFILDYNMEFIDGNAITKYLRLDKTGKKIPVIMISASGKKKAAEAAGVSHYMEKPIHVKELIHLVDEIFNGPPQLFLKQAWPYHFWECRVSLLLGFLLYIRNRINSGVSKKDF